MLEWKRDLEEDRPVPNVHPWLTPSATAQWAGGPGCATHPSHQMIKIAVNYPEPVGNAWLNVFDAGTYYDTPGYCMGDDDVSRTLIRIGQWEPVETRAFVAALTKTEGVVIDFGAQLGWYTILSALMGRDVLAVEPVAEHCELILANAVVNHVEDKILIAQTWIDSHSPMLGHSGAPKVAIAKIDLEGNDTFAVDVLEQLIYNVNVANILCEISPVFNDTYPELIHWLLQDYTAEVVNPWHPVRADNVEQVLADCGGQMDMMFRRKP